MSGSLEIKELNRICPICGCKEGVVLHTLKTKLPEEYKLPTEYDIVSCSGCGFSYADVDANQDVYNTYYKNCNMYSSYSTIRDKLTLANNKIRMEVINKYVPKDSKILDIGCGGGDFLQTLQKNGYQNLIGIDPSDISVNRIRNELGIQCQVGNIFDDAPENLRGQMDLICCTMVGEHIYDLENFVPKLKQYIKPDKGMIFMDVPSVEGFARYPRKISNYFNHEHINYFSLNALDRLFAKSGFVRRNTTEDSYKVLEIEQTELALETLYIIDTHAKCEKGADDTSLNSLKHYFEIVKDQEQNNLNQIIEYIEKSKNGVVIWGTGSYCMQTLEKLNQHAERIRFFVDNNNTKWGKQINGIEICSADKMKELQGSVDVLILVMQQPEDVVNQLEGMGIEHTYCIG